MMDEVVLVKSKQALLVLAAILTIVIYALSFVEMELFMLILRLTEMMAIFLMMMDAAMIDLSNTDTLEMVELHFRLMFAKQNVVTAFF